MIAIVDTYPPAYLNIHTFASHKELSIFNVQVSRKSQVTEEQIPRDKSFRQNVYLQWRQ